MPQFDKITFFNQVFWLFIFFSMSYILFLKLFLPKLAQLMKARTKVLSKSGNRIDEFSLEQQNTNLAFNSLIEKLIFMVKENTLSSGNNSSDWVKFNKLELSNNKLVKPNLLLEKAIYKQIVLDYLLSKNKK